MNEVPQPHVQPSDSSLVRRLQRGEQDAATQLYLRYATRLQHLAQAQQGRSLVSRFDPEDVVQSVFRTFFRRAAEGLYQVPPGQQLWQLLLVLALNKVRALGAYHRAKKRDVDRTRGSPALERFNGTADPAPLQILKLVIDEQIGKLPEAHRNIVQLRIEGHEVQQIAERTGRAKRTVERILQAFREHLAQCLEDKI